MMKKRILFVFLLMFQVIAVMAIPAKRGLWKTLKLADGTEVRAELRGDEHVHFWQTEDGTRLMKDGDVYVVVDENVVVSRMVKRRSAIAASRAKSPRKVSMGERTHYLGQKKGIVILAQFKDVKFKTANNLAKYKKILNEENYTTSEGFQGSVSDYFKAQSTGQFELDFDVVGPYTMTNNRSYYGGNNSNGDDKNAEAMVVAACKAANAEVNFADYDWDGDGEVDQVFVLYAGTGEADSYDSDAIWPHMYYLSASNKQLTLDGVKIDTYACSNEVDMYGGIEGIGCFCHEFSHCMGFPDFYDTSYNGFFGMSQFDLMDSGSYNGGTFIPAGYSAHEKMMCGWQEPIELAEEDVNVENLKALSDGGESYIIYNKAHTDEYYMIENRQQMGWDAGLPSKGLMITHVDFDKTIWQYNVPNTKVASNSEMYLKYGYPLNDHQRCTIFHADNDDDASYWNSANQRYSKTTLTNDLYPYRGNDSLTNNSQPAATLFNKNTDGKKFMNRRILSIKQNSDKTVSFVYKASLQDENPTPQPTDYLFYESFNKCKGKGGNDNTWSGSIATSAFTPDNDGWVVVKEGGASGCAKFGTTSQAGSATTPAIALNGWGLLKFKAAAWKSTGETTTLKLSAAGGTIDKVSVELTKAEWNDYEVNVTGTGALKITFASNQDKTSRFFLDDIYVYETEAPSAIEGVEPQTEQTKVIYNLAGQRVSKPTKGLYIINGRKVMIK